MVAASLLAAVLQAGTAQQALTCSLVSTAGDSIAFLTTIEGQGRLRLVPVAGGDWPARSIMGTRAVGARPESFSRNAFAFGDARQGVLLHLGSASTGEDWQVATLYDRDGANAGLPLAYGFCRQATLFTPSDVSAASADGSVDTRMFDPARWPEGDCALITLAGHRAKFRFTVRNAGQVEFVSGDAGIWNGQPERVEHRVTRDVDGGSPGAATLSSASGLDGIEMMFARFDPPRAVNLLQFRRLGGAGPMAAQPAFAICGHRVLVRRRAN